MSKLYYFGTQLDRSGHEFWQIQNEYFKRDTEIENKVPINVYFAANEKKGTCLFFSLWGYTGLAISGSPCDKRSGTVSVFFIQDNIDKESFFDILRGNELSKDICSRIGFDLAITKT